MAIGNYAELKTALAGWIHRTDLQAVIPDFIMLAESRINRELPLRVMDVDVDLTATPSSRFIALPPDYVMPYALYLTTVLPRKKLVFKEASTIQINEATGWPEYWTINGSTIELNMPADLAHTFVFKYRRSFNLTIAAPVNWLLTNHPDLYLYASLMESAIYTRDDERLSLFQNRYDLALLQIRSKEMESKGLATLGSEVSELVAPGKTDITSGE